MLLNLVQSGCVVAQSDNATEPSAHRPPPASPAGGGSAGRRAGELEGGGEPGAGGPNIRASSWARISRQSVGAAGGPRAAAAVPPGARAGEAIHAGAGTLCPGREPPILGG
jgi:hypothetical protein